jgi:hypothetical protein
MKCPEYIKEALRQRARYARRFLELDCMVGEWLSKNNLLDEVEDYDIYGGCEAYCNPEDSSKRIIEVIENA